ncbi:hypothetical protein SUGI_0692980 [Cryptomeria japonica]|nr:hypothetical protein SUGI_0692980 [Cryptomeria japonica]
MILRTSWWWLPPDVGWIKCNFDDFSKGNLRISKAGGLISDHKGFLVVGYGLGLSTTTNNKAKAWAAWIGLQCLSDITRRNVILEGDSKLLVNCLNNVTSPPWEIKEIIGRCKCLIELFDEIKIHVYREGNRSNDLIANESLNMLVGRFSNLRTTLES